MDVENDIAQIIWDAAMVDDIYKLDAWLEQRPDCLYLLDKCLNKNIFRFALDNRRLRLLTWALGVHDQPFYDELLKEGIEHEHEWVRRRVKLTLNPTRAHGFSLAQDITDCWRSL